MSWFKGEDAGRLLTLDTVSHVRVWPADLVVREPVVVLLCFLECPVTCRM